jgi:hypothetical protein
MLAIVENNKLKKFREDNGKVMKYEKLGSIQTCTFDRCASRYQIVLSKLPSGEYAVVISNYYFGMTTLTPQNIAYKLIEKDIMSNVDAESVELAIEWMMKQ